MRRRRTEPQSGSPPRKPAVAASAWLAVANGGSLLLDLSPQSPYLAEPEVDVSNACMMMRTRGDANGRECFVVILRSFAHRKTRANASL